jgi:hypothetical protein
LCFLAVFRLRRVIDSYNFARILQELGFFIDVRGSVVEARRDRAMDRVLIDRDRVEVETNNYGEECLKDYGYIVKWFIEHGTKPEVVYFADPYIYGYEKKRGKLKKLLKELSLETEEIYSGLCG